MKILLTFLALFAIIQANSQSAKHTIHTAFVKTGAYAKQPDALSFTSNQASLVHAASFQAAVMGERRFMLEELGWYRAGFIIPTAGGGIGMQVNYCGNSNNITTSLGLAYGRKMGQQFAMGAQFGYRYQKIPAYNNSQEIAAEVGGLLNVSPAVNVSFHMHHPYNVSAIEKSIKLPAIYTTGLGYNPSEQLLFIVELQKEQNRNINCIAGIEYRFAKLLLARLGLQSETSTYSFGTGIQLHQFRLDVMAALHPQLGFTPGLALHFQPNQVLHEK